MHTYRRAVLFFDAAVLLVAVLLAEGLRFGTDGAMPTGTSVTYTMLGALIAGGWWIALQLHGSTDERILGHGPEEYRRVTHASVMAFGLLAIVTLLLKGDLSRGYLAIAFPVGLAGLVTGRKCLRAWLIRQRRSGGFVTNVLVIGGTRSAESIARSLERHFSAGLRVTGVWVPDQRWPDGEHLTGLREPIPVKGSAADLSEAMTQARASMAIVTDTEHLGHHGLRELTWELSALGADLMVSPNVMDVATPRLHLRTVGSMPFMHVGKPTFEGATRWGKLVFDRVFATVALVALSPIMLGAWIAVRVSSRGPALYRSERIGAGGRPFEMLKFRSMVVDADKKRDHLTSETDGPLFKQRNDPRVTRVGRVLRKHSIDELPQLINVLRGDMSIVGPRPPLRSELDHYDESIGRRLLVKQGITGLWQVSGRSDLSWDDTVRLDLDYVENWSLWRDVGIIWRTIRAVARPDGAY